MLTRRTAERESTQSDRFRVRVIEQVLQRRLPDCPRQLPPIQPLQQLLVQQHARRSLQRLVSVYTFPMFLS